jgi:Transposase
LSQIAHELGIPAAQLRAWRNTTGDGQAGSPRRPNTQAAIPSVGADLAAENARLRRENERLRMERDGATVPPPQEHKAGRLGPVFTIYSRGSSQPGCNLGELF